MSIHFASRKLALIVACCSAILLSGCARMGSLSRVDPLSVAVYPGGRNTTESAASARGPDGCPLASGVNSFSSGAVDLNCFRFPENLGEFGNRSLAYSRAVGHQRERNRLTALLLKHSDDICVEEMGRLNSNESAVNTSLSILNTGLTSTANIVTGQLAGAILTGGATLAGSARDHINAHVYRNTFAYAISRAITLERQRLRGLLEGRYRENTTHFTVDEAIRAANEYHGACSFYKGLELVLASVEGDQRSRDAQARQTQLETIDREIRMQEAAMLSVKEADRGPYRTNIAALHARRQALTLASVPVPPSAEAEEDDEEEDDDDAPDPPPTPTPAPSPTP